MTACHPAWCQAQLVLGCVMHWNALECISEAICTVMWRHALDQPKDVQASHDTNASIHRGQSWHRHISWCPWSICKSWRIDMLHMSSLILCSWSTQPIDTKYTEFTLATSAATKALCNKTRKTPRGIIDPTSITACGRYASTHDIFKAKMLMKG